MWRGRGQGSAREVVLVSEVMGGLGMVAVMVRLLGMVWVMGLRLELGHLHAKSLVALATIHHDMLALVALAVHGESGLWGCSRGRGSVRVEFQSPRRGIGPVSKEVSLLL